VNSLNSQPFSESSDATDPFARKSQYIRQGTR
jgi:hypothetical protein